MRIQRQITHATQAVARQLKEEFDKAEADRARHAKAQLEQAKRAEDEAKVGVLLVLRPLFSHGSLGLDEQVSRARGQTAASQGRPVGCRA